MAEYAGLFTTASYTGTVTIGSSTSWYLYNTNGFPMYIRGGTINMTGGTIYHQSGSSVVCVFRIGDSSIMNHSGGTIKANYGSGSIALYDSGTYNLRGGTATRYSSSYYSIYVNGSSTFNYYSGSYTGLRRQ